MTAAAPGREEISAIIADWFPGKQFLRDGCADAILARLAAKTADEIDDDTSPFKGLNALVQYRQKENGIVWHNMAAFDSMGIAERYRDKQGARRSALRISRRRPVYHGRAKAMKDAILFYISNGIGVLILLAGIMVLFRPRGGER